jgi:hypothetical protein
LPRWLVRWFVSSAYAVLRLEIRVSGGQSPLPLRLFDAFIDQLLRNGRFVLRQDLRCCDPGGSRRLIPLGEIFRSRLEFRRRATRGRFSCGCFDFLRSKILVFVWKRRFRLGGVLICFDRIESPRGVSAGRTTS